MPSAETAVRTLDAPFAFELRPEREAKVPPEARGSGRDDVRLLVTHALGSIAHAHFRQLPELLGRGDVVVLNRSATIPAALRAHRDDGSPVELHVSTRLPADLVIVEPWAAHVEAFERLRLPSSAVVEFLTPYRDSKRLWIARLYLPVPYLPYVMACGRPIRYPHLGGDWPLAAFQNVYASDPGSAEMPSAGRPFTHELLAQLRGRNVEIAYITLHAGVSSPERDEPPYDEAFNVPAETAEAIRRARRHGGRVVAVGTTVVRALESSLDAGGRVVASQGWTDLYITPQRGVSTVDAVVTGFHEPKSSHLAMLEAIAGRDTIRRSYAAALAANYLWHEFGDSQLIMR